MTPAGVKSFSKTFSELSPGELYAILRIRAKVFVAGQRCFYLDPDVVEAGIPHGRMEKHALA